MISASLSSWELVVSKGDIQVLKSHPSILSTGLSMRARHEGFSVLPVIQDVACHPLGQARGDRRQSVGKDECLRLGGKLI